MTLKSKPRKELVLMERDKNALMAIYHAGIVAAGHLVRLFWGGMSYGYVRLRMLADAGFLGTDTYKEPVPGIKKRRKVTSFYYLKKAAIDYLSDLDDQPLRPAWKNKLPKSKFQEYYRMGELWCRLFEAGVIARPLDWLPSRSAKKALGIKDFVPLHAAVYTVYNPEKDFDVLYYFDDQTDTRKIAKLRSLMPEVDLSGAKRHFIICQTPKAMRKVLKKFSMRCHGKNVYIILQENAADLIDFLRDPGVFYKELLVKLGVPKGTVILPASPTDTAPYFFYDTHGKTYVVELVSGNLSALDALRLEGYNPHIPERLCCYVSGYQQYKSIKFLFSEKLKGLQLVSRDRPNKEKRA